MNAGTYVSASPEETRSLARKFSAALLPGDVILLHGDLGLGKTCFVQGLAEGLGWTGAVLSPTFSLLQEYETHPPLAHADLYRLESPEAVYGLGLEELMDDGFVLAVEWPSRCPQVWPANAWQVRLCAVDGNENARRIELAQGTAAL